MADRKITYALRLEQGNMVGPFEDANIAAKYGCKNICGNWTIVILMEPLKVSLDD